MVCPGKVGGVGGPGLCHGSAASIKSDADAAAPPKDDKKVQINDPLP